MLINISPSNVFPIMFFEQNFITIVRLLLAAVSINGLRDLVGKYKDFPELIHINNKIFLILQVLWRMEGMKEVFIEL